MAVEIFYDDDADLSIVQNRRVAVARHPPRPITNTSERPIP